jgi:hypothetical protein
MKRKAALPDPEGPAPILAKGAPIGDYNCQAPTDDSADNRPHAQVKPNLSAAEKSFPFEHRQK